MKERKKKNNENNKADLKAHKSVCSSSPVPSSLFAFPFHAGHALAEVSPYWMSFVVWLCDYVYSIYIPRIIVT